MPYYEVQHIVPLTVAQQDELAEAITTLHATHFTTPRIFVNVTFIDAHATPTYIGGRRRAANYVRAAVRTGPSRSRADWDALCRDIVAAWDRIVPMPSAKRGEPDLKQFELWACVVLGGGFASVYEAGFLLPEAGGDVAWLKENWAEFQKRAEGGDEDFREMVREVQERGLLEGVNGA